MGSLAGAAIGAVGSYMSSKKQSKAAKRAAAAAKFDPWGGSFTGGNISWDDANQTWDASLGGPEQAIYDQMGGLTSGFLGGSGYAGQVVPHLQNIGNDMPGLYGQAQNALGQLPTGVINSYMGGSLGREGLSNMAGAGFLGQVMGQQGMTNAANQTALNLGLNAFNTPDPAGYRDVYANRLGLLREQAEPFERRQVLGELNSQFGRGIMNANSGALRQEALASGLAQADTARQLDAMGFSENLWQRDMQNVQNQRGLGLQMFGQGMQGNLNAQNLYGSLGGNMLANAQNFATGAYNAGIYGNELQSQRALQRLQNAQQLFGFGQAAQGQDFQTGLGMLGASQGMQDQLRQWTALGAQAGGMQASAGQNVGKFGMAGARNNMGDFIGGIGGGMMDGSIDMSKVGDWLGGLFKGKPEDNGPYSI